MIDFESTCWENKNVSKKPEISKFNNIYYTLTLIHISWNSIQAIGSENMLPW